jgi:hypothetical protein
MLRTGSPDSAPLDIAHAGFQILEIAMNVPATRLIAEESIPTERKLGRRPVVTAGCNQPFWHRFVLVPARRTAFQQAD